MLWGNEHGLAKYEVIICPEQWDGGEILKNSQKAKGFNPSTPSWKDLSCQGPKAKGGDVSQLIMVHSAISYHILSKTRQDV